MARSSNRRVQVFHEPLKDRRSAPRIRSVYWLVAVECGGDIGVARCHDISNGGIRIEADFPIMLNDRVRVAFSPQATLEGSVVWTSGKECGVKFETPIDSNQLLRQTVDSNRNAASKRRLVDLKVDIPVSLGGQGGGRPGVLKSVSRYEVSVLDDGGFQPGLDVQIILPSGREIQGIVKSSDNSLANIALNPSLDPPELRR